MVEYLVSGMLMLMLIARFERYIRAPPKVDQLNTRSPSSALLFFFGGRVQVPLLK